MLVGISALVATVAFIVLVIFVIRFLQETGRAVHEVQQAVTELRNGLGMVADRSISLLAKSEQLVEQVDTKLRSLDPIAQSVREAGDSMAKVARSVRQTSQVLAHSVDQFGATVNRYKDRSVDLAELVSVGMQIWNRWQAGRKSGASAVSGGKE